MTFLNSRTNCPICGTMSEILPGQYKIVKGSVNLLLDPSVTPEALEALRSVADRLQRNEISREEAIAEASKISPKFSAIF